MRLSEALEVFRTACYHIRESENLLEAARLEAQQLIASLGRSRNTTEVGGLSASEAR